jgi:glycosyltransferase involved in cell wall biosynthesis
MTHLKTIRDQFDELHVCVVIPTYNNASTLAGVIASVSEYSDHIIVVNDGSTDDTQAIVQTFPFVQLISYPENKGKGWALRKAFSYAVEQDYQFAISIDSDGQHFAKDLPVFIEKLKTVQDAIIMGSRNMDQSSIPGKSSFGHKFSNFWFKVETGINCPDTQSGYRLYPLLLLKDIRFITRKFEYEIEVLVRAAWKGIKVESVPVAVYYAPKEERVSHFRPFKDFTRISILNTILVIIAFLYIKPRDFLRSLTKKKLDQIFKEQIFHPHHSDEFKAASLAFGVFMGIFPIWGFQMGTAIFLAILFRMNKALVIIGANISIPPMIPLIIFASYKMGGLWMGTHAGTLEFSRNISRESIRDNIEQYLYGSISLAVLAAVVFGLLTYLLLKLFKRKPLLAG